MKQSMLALKVYIKREEEATKAVILSNCAI